MHFASTNVMRLNSAILYLVILIMVIFWSPQTLFASSCRQLFSDSNFLSFNQQLIPSQYHLQPMIAGKIILYRGDRVGLEGIGIPSKALAEGDLAAISHAKDIFERTSFQKMDEAIDKHTTGSSRSPFVSASFNPRLAQMFATNSHRRNRSKPQQTIYRIEIDPSRGILDVHDRGGAGASGEVFILGGVRPEENDTNRLVKE